MKKTKEKHNCWFLINQDQEKRKFETLEQQAATIFLDFLKDKEYGKGISLFRFDIYIKPTINYGQHTDTTYNSTAHLSIHIDKLAFEKSTEPEKLKLLLSASYILIKYLKEKVALPKDFNVTDLVIDYENYLTKNNFLLDKTQIDKVIYKHFETTRFNFRRTETVEVDKSKIHFDLNEIEDYINNKIAGKTFGKSINTFDFGFELYDFNGGFATFLKQTENYKRYGTKYKNYLVVKHFDYSTVRELNRKQQYNLLKSKILEGLNDFDSLSKKPKDFDKAKLYEILKNALDEYEEKH